MTITNFDRFRLERQQQKLKLQQTLVEQQQKQQQQPQQHCPVVKTTRDYHAAAPNLTATSSAAHKYREPRGQRKFARHSDELSEKPREDDRDHNDDHDESQEEQAQDTTMIGLRASRATGAVAGPTAARASSLSHRQQLQQTRAPARHHEQQAASGHKARKSEQQQQQQQVQQEVWSSTEDLFWDHMREVQNKWNTLKLNDDIWAKLIYFERNRRLAKAYVSTPVLTVDGSTSGLDGFRIGLSGIENSYRDLDSMACLCSIGHGIRLKIDSHGNILIRKLSPAQQQQPQQQPQLHKRPAALKKNCSIWVREWPASSYFKSGGGGSGGGVGAQHQLQRVSSSSTCSSAGSSSGTSSSDYSQLSVCELLESNSSYKLFDMQKFRAQLAEQGRAHSSSSSSLSSSSLAVDWRQCVSIISFGAQTSVGAKGQQQILSDPCWLMLINIIAIDMLKRSICDISSRPSPSSQTSALINKYQRGHELRAAAAKTQTSAQMRGPRTHRPPAGATSGASKLQHQQASLSSSASSSSSMLMTTRQQQQQQRQQQQHYAAGGLFLNRPNHQQATSADGSIYTTFTGKYLDKQQRMRASKTRNSQARDNFPLAPALHYQGSSFDDLRRPTRRAPSLAPAGHHHHLDAPSHRLLYPLDAFPVVPSLARGQLCDRFGRLLPLTERVGARIGAGLAPPLSTGGRRPGGEARSQLSHSLSAFDLSHGLSRGALNLRSINTSSIKMNFDSGDDDDDELEDQNEDEDPHVEQSDSVERPGNERAPLDGASPKHPAEASSVDNDYFISQSSNSSMSSSMRSNTGEEPEEGGAFSQTTSSSGIMSASTGNTSDEYSERQGSTAAKDTGASLEVHDSKMQAPDSGGGGGGDASEQTPVTTTTTTNSTIMTNDSTTTISTTKDRKSTLSQVKCSNLGNKKAPGRRLNTNVSLQRCYNVKTIDYSDDELESTKCGAGLSCQLYHGSSTTSPPLPLAQPNGLQRCDCGEPNCDQFIALESAAPCDCCCYCFST